MATKAQIIDGYFRQQNYFKHIPYVPIGDTVVSEVERMGTNGLWVSTAAALIEQESGGKNLFGCDWGSRWTNVPPFCQVQVTAERVRALIANYNRPPRGLGANGVGYTQLTYMPFVIQAQQLGGAHLPSINMRVGFDILNDMIALYGWPSGAGAYNAGPARRNTAGAVYQRQLAFKQQQWQKRLGRTREDTGEGHGKPSKKKIVPRKGLGKDGNPNFWYNAQHPTNYNWRPDVREFVEEMINLEQFKRKIWINTYFRHPPGWNRDITSFDVWAWGGRGDPLTPQMRKEVFNYIFRYQKAPDIWWIISGGGMWTRAGGWQNAPWGPVGSDAGHWLHVHTTMLDWVAQQRIRG